MISVMVAAAVPAGALNYVGNLDFSLTNAAGMQNDEITIQLDLNQNDGLYSFWLLLYYDESAFILRDTKYNDAFLEYGSFEKTDDNLPVDRLKGDVAKYTLEDFADYNISTNDKLFKVLYFESDDLENNVDFTGTIATFTFQIVGIADDGDYTIGIMPGDESAINIDIEDLSVSRTNATVSVGTSKVPTETQKTLTYEDTLDPSEITEQEAAPSREDVESKALEETTTPAETFIGEDGKVYVTNDEGETVEYTPETEEEAKNITSESGDREPAETEAITDVEVTTVGAAKNTIKLFGKDIPLVYFIIAIILVLIAIAAVLTAIISKTKKASKEIEEEQEK
jgi:hypothetical protein